MTSTSSVQPSTHEQPMLVLCAWCPDKAERDRAAEAAGHSVTHGICEPCKARFLAEARDIEPQQFQQTSVRFSCRLTRASLSPVCAAR